MIIIQDNLVFTASFRTNRRVQWRYATYAGRWESLDRAIAEVKERLNGQAGEYRIEDSASDNVHVGTL